RLIRRALVDADVVVDVNGQLAAPDVAGVCVFNAHRPILNVVDPTLTEGACVNHAAVVDQKPLVVVCVQQPAHLQLFDIVGASGGLSAGFGAGKRGQQHGGKDRYDRYHH